MFTLGPAERERGREYHPDSSGADKVNAKKVLGVAGASEFMGAVWAVGASAEALRAFPSNCACACCQCRAQVDDSQDRFTATGGCDVWDVTFVGWTRDNFKWRLEGRDFNRAIYAEGPDGQSPPQNLSDVAVRAVRSGMRSKLMPVA